MYDRMTDNVTMLTSEKVPSLPDNRYEQKGVCYDLMVRVLEYISSMSYTHLNYFLDRIFIRPNLFVSTLLN